MFFDEIKEIPTYIDQTGFSIISADPEEAKKLLQKVYKTNVFFLSPDEKTGKISIEQIRDFVALTETKDKSDKYFVVLSSEKMNTAFRPPTDNSFARTCFLPKTKRQSQKPYLCRRKNQKLCKKVDYCRFKNINRARNGTF